MKKLLSLLVLLETALLCHNIEINIIDDLLLILAGIRIDDTEKCLPFNSSRIKFQLFNPSHLETPITLTKDTIREVNPSFETKLLSHGWVGNPTTWGVRAKDEYLKYGNYNVILINWSKYADENYAQSVCQIVNVGQLAGALILHLKKVVGIDLNRVHFIGHSLGAHVGGYAGQTVINGTNGLKIGRITGLDAAGPGFILLARVDELRRLAKGDANFVDAIHTNGGVLGYLKPYADVDFFPNSGSVQPGCIKHYIKGTFSVVRKFFSRIACSHYRAHELFIESISSFKFVARYCGGHIRFRLKLCMFNNKLLMGEHATFPPKENKRTYYLKTNDHSPYARG